MDNVDYERKEIKEIKKMGESYLGKENTNFGVDKFYHLLDVNKEKNKKILSNELSKDNKHFFKYYYSLIFLLENQFENYNEFQKTLRIESLELEALNKIIEHCLDFGKTKQEINSFLNTHFNYLRKNFDMCESITDIKEKQKIYIDSVNHIKEMFENQNVITDIESSVNYEKK